MLMLEGYTYVHGAGKTGLVRSEYQDVLANAVLKGQGWMPDNSSGRDIVYRFPMQSGSGIIREYRRGGLIRRINRGAYLTNRPLAELRVTDYLWREGLPVPEPLGICWWRHLGLLHGRIATKALDSMTLQSYLTKETKPSRALLRRIGETVRRVHDAGVFHADLQVRNILLAENDAYIIDFDRARGPKPVSPRARAANLLRLRRSFEKNGLVMRWYDEVAMGYGAIHGFHLLSVYYRAKSILTGSAARK